MSDLEQAQELQLAQLCPCAESVFKPDYPRIAEALTAARVEEREKVAAFMLARSIATGHGDTIEDLLAELGGYLDRLHQSIDEV